MPYRLNLLIPTTLPALQARQALLTFKLVEVNHFVLLMFIGHLLKAVLFMPKHNYLLLAHKALIQKQRAIMFVQ